MFWRFFRSISKVQLDWGFPLPSDGKCRARGIACDNERRGRKRAGRKRLRLAGFNWAIYRTKNIPSIGSRFQRRSHAISFFVFIPSSNHLRTSGACLQENASEALEACAKPWTSARARAANLLSSFSRCAFFSDVISLPVSRSQWEDRCPHRDCV